MWNPEAGPPPDQLIHAIQESRAILQTSSAILSQEGGAATEAETGAQQDPELWDQDEDEAEEVEGFEEAHAPRGPPVEVRQHAQPRQNAHLRRRHSRRRREPRSRRRWRKGVLYFRRSNFCQCEQCRIPGARNKTRFRNGRARSFQP